MKKTVKTNTVIDWSVADAMTDEERRAAAMADPDAVPMTDEEWAEAPRVAQVKTTGVRSSFRKRNSQLRFIFQSGR